MSDYHSIIIGSGSGGLTAAVGLTGFGKKVAMVERAAVGGDCTNVGCIPSKTLIHAVNHPQGRTPEQILAHVRERRNHLRDEETEWVEGMAKVDFIRGEASFVDDTTIEVAQDEDVKRISAKHIIIAAGSSPRIIPIQGLPDDKFLTNEKLFELEQPPRNLVIIGGGVIATEMAFAFCALGSKVTMLELAPRVLSVFSEDVSQVITASLEAKGVVVHTGVTVQQFAAGRLELSNGISLADVDYVLQAVGRVPNLASLKLENTTLEYNEKGVFTNAYGATNVPSIHAIGDVTHTAAFTHAANAQGRRLVTRLALPFLPRFAPEPEYPSATFSQPEVAQIGASLETLQERYHPELIATHTHDLAKTDRGYTMDYTEEASQGFVKIHAMRLTGRVLAVEIVAPNAGEMIPLLTFAVTNKQSMYKLANLIYPYPILSEAIKKAADAFVFGSLPKLHKEIGAYLRYRWRSLGVVRWCAGMFTKLLAR